MEFTERENSMKRLAVAGIVSAGAAFAHSGVQDADVMARMEDMKQMGSVMKQLGAMAKGQAAFDPGEANDGLAAIARGAGAIPDVFATPATDPKSEALPVIWDRFDDFTANARDLETLAAGLAGSVTAQNELDAALRQVGLACKSCHTDYRE